MKLYIFLGLRIFKFFFFGFNAVFYVERLYFRNKLHFKIKMEYIFLQGTNPSTNLSKKYSESEAKPLG